MEWLGHSKVSFTHHKEPLKLTTKDGKETDLLRVCEAVTPPCKLNPLLFNGHLQTMWTAMDHGGPAVWYKRRVFDNEDPAFHGTFAVDFVVPENSATDASLPPRTTYFTDAEFAALPSDDTKPMLICLHGLSGGSYEIYLRQCLKPLIDDGGWEACVVNSRGCAMHQISSSVLYNARASWDVRQMVKWLRKTFPNRPLFGIGFSLGANILTTYVGEEGAACELKAAVVCSNPWNLDASSLALRRGFFSREVYSKTMGSSMKKLLNNHLEQLKTNTNLDIGAIMKIKYLHEFDRLVQCPTWGYPTEGAYYRDASSTDAIGAIRIPFLAINAVDDPISVDEALPWEEMKQNPYTIMCTTTMGGHLSWFEVGGNRWHSRPCVNFLNAMAFEIESPNQAKVEKMLHLNGSAATEFRKRYAFEPMRRKMHPPDSFE